MTTQHAAQRAGERTGPRWLGTRTVLAVGVIGALAGLIVLTAATGTSRYSQTGDSYPGALTATAQTVGYFGATLCGGLCVGALVFVVMRARPDADRIIDAGVFRAHVLIERAAVVWAAAAAAMVVVSAADATGVAVTRLVSSGALGPAIDASEQSKAWIVVAVCALVVAIIAGWSLRWISHLLLVVPAATAVMAVPVTGNAGQGPNHDYATSTVMVFVVAFAVLLGGAVAATTSPVRESGDTGARRTALAAAVVATIAVVFGTILVGIFVPLRFLTSTGYGRLALAAAGLLVVVWVLSLLALTRRGVPRWAGPLTAVLLIWASAVISAMAIRTAPGLLAHDFTAWDVFLGYRLPGPPTVMRLLTWWRFDTLIGAGAVAMAGIYGFGVLRLRRRGDRWPAGRTTAWMLGSAALLLASSSGAKAYGSAMFSVHMGEHMVMNMFIPVLLVLGAPATLALRALPAAGAERPPGPREWLLWLLHSSITRFLSHPITAFVLFVGSPFVVYFSPLFDTLMRYHWGHELMSIHFLLTGYLFFWSIIGIDPGPKRLPFLARLGLLFAVMPFHAFFGIATMTTSSVIGSTFYRYLDLPWVGDLAHDQWVGGAIAWGSGELPVLIVVIALVTQWARQDRRDGARRDRHADAGRYGDDDLDAYNAMLAELARSRR